MVLGGFGAGDMEAAAVAAAAVGPSSVVDRLGRPHGGRAAVAAGAGLVAAVRGASCQLVDGGRIDEGDGGDGGWGMRQRPLL